jgi:hypothetical protein
MGERALVLTEFCRENMVEKARVMELAFFLHFEVSC